MGFGDLFKLDRFAAQSKQISRDLVGGIIASSSLRTAAIISRIDLPQDLRMKLDITAPAVLPFLGIVAWPEHFQAHYGSLDGAAWLSWDYEPAHRRWELTRATSWCEGGFLVSQPGAAVEPPTGVWMRFVSGHVDPMALLRDHTKWVASSQAEFGTTYAIKNVQDLQHGLHAFLDLFVVDQLKALLAEGGEELIRQWAEHATGRTLTKAELVSLVPETRKLARAQLDLRG